jgi:cytoskeletal protein RodZ
MAAGRKSDGFGNRLREARERRGISLRQIANATKISMSTLEALERNDLSRLPGGIFSRAFVRSYAIEVGLDPDKTINDFIAQLPTDPVTAGHPASEPSDDYDAHESNRKTATAFVRLIAISVPIVAAVLYFGSRVGRAPEAESPASSRAASERPPESPPASSVLSSPDVAPPAAAEGVVPPATRQAKPEPAKPEPARPAPATPAPATPAPAALEPATPPIDPPARGSEPVSATIERMTVSLVATGPCWVLAIADGETAVARELQAGDRVSFDVERDVVLTAGDPAALEMTLNGAGARPLGGAGRSVTVRMTPSNFKQYLATP